MSCSRPHGAAPSGAEAPPSDSEWLDLLELLPDWSDGFLGDALDGILAESDSVDSETLSGDQRKDDCARRRGRNKKPSTRAQRAMEIRGLQRECDDLCETLRALREAAKAAGLSLQDTTAGSLSRRIGAAMHSPSTSSSWAARAGTQREMLLLVERASRELKRAVRTQKLEARSLHRVLTKRIADAQMLWNQLYSSVDAMPTPSSLPTPIFSDTRLVFAKLLQETEAMRFKVDGVLQHLRAKVALPVASGSFQEWKMTRCSNELDTVFVEMIDVEELPFSISNVCNAIESMYRTYEMDHFAEQHPDQTSVLICGFGTQNFNASDDTIMATSFFTYDHGEGTMHARLRQVAQHFRSDAYAAFVSTFIVELLAPGKDAPVDTVQEWRIVSASEDGATLHQTFAVLQPRIAQSIATLSGFQRLFHGLVDTWLASFSCTNQEIENLLLNPPTSAHALRRKRPQLREKNWAQPEGERRQSARQSTETQRLECGLEHISCG